MNDLANSHMTTNPPKRIDFNTPELQRKRRIRALKDRFTRWYVLVGGLAVLAAITLIFFFLAYVVAPLFQGADLTAKDSITPAWMQDAGKPLMISLEEQNQVAMRVSDKGQALFFDIDSGAELKRVDLPVPAGATVTSIGEDQPGHPLVAVGLSNGQALVFRHTYKVSYPDGKKTITPAIEYPYGETPIALNEAGGALEHVSLNATDTTLMLVGSTGSQLNVLSLTSEENMMTGEVTNEQKRIDLPQMTEPVKNIFVDPRQQWLYVVNGRAQADVFSLRDKSLNGRYKLLENADAEVTATTQLVGGISLIVGDSKGGLAQWFMARDTDGELRLKQIRTFQMAPRRSLKSPPKSGAKASSPWMPAASSACSTAPHTARCWLIRWSMVKAYSACHRAPTVSSSKPAASCNHCCSTTRTRKFPGARCGARSGTRTTTSLNTSGNRPPPTPISNRN
jgi:phosphate transport system permease protein